MSNFKTNPNQPNFWAWHARATVKFVKARVTNWQCPKCKTDNRIVQLPGDRRGSSPWRLEGKCGHCHGNYVTLITSDDYDITPRP